MAEFGEVAFVGYVVKFKADVFDADFGDGWGELADDGFPLGFDVETKRAVEMDGVAFDAFDCADQGCLCAAVEWPPDLCRTGD